jgi:3'-phosphoadenosine 5'-phosphosulfate sulfotransferase (PAPS reductase)/FAD synthetase
MLGRKQHIKNSDWHYALNNIENIVLRAQLNTLTDKTVADIRRNTQGKNTAFAWSGGKDSRVLEKLCYLADVRECVLVISELEYPAFLRWVTDHMPPLLEVVSTGQDIEWLKRNINMLFPQDSATAGKWFYIVQHRGQAQYYKKYGLDSIILGRRKADGNYVGAGTNIYTSQNGVTRYSPLADWRHEDILAFLHYCDIPLPPFYAWTNGYYCGTHPWAARQWTGAIQNGWHEVYSIDPTIVIEAADYIDSAKLYLESMVK